MWKLKNLGKYKWKYMGIAFRRSRQFRIMTILFELREMYYFPVNSQNLLSHMLRQQLVRYELRLGFLFSFVLRMRDCI